MLSQKRVNEMDKQLLHYKFNEMPKTYFQTYSQNLDKYLISRYRL